MLLKEKQTFIFLQKLCKIKFVSDVAFYFKFGKIFWLAMHYFVSIVVVESLVKFKVVLVVKRFFI